MKITSVNCAPNFKADGGIAGFETFQQKPKKEKKYKDPLTNWPLRGLGYTNDIGIAINELAPATARLFWVPALMYFGADIYDKYKNKGDKYKPNAARAFNQAIFQACASIMFPAIFGHMGMTAFSVMDKYRGDKLSTNAKEQTLRFIKGHSALHEVLDNGKDKEVTLEEFNKNFAKYYKVKKKGYTRRNFLVKAYDTLLANCHRGAVANANEVRIKDYAQRQFLEILEKCSDTDMAKNVLDKKIFRLKAWKSAGAFTAIILTASAVDKFVEKVIIKKFVKPIQSTINSRKTVSFSDFNKLRAKESEAK
ncbi:MAG: hypothetical protein NC191_08805 [Muribaculaceae bacterium]|nr:hypothetical protein [Muribaculaceae bacterium]